MGSALRFSLALSLLRALPVRFGPRTSLSFFILLPQIVLPSLIFFLCSVGFLLFLRSFPLSVLLLPESFPLAGCYLSLRGCCDRRPCTIILSPLSSIFECVISRVELNSRMLILVPDFRRSETVLLKRTPLWPSCSPHSYPDEVLAPGADSSL